MRVADARGSLLTLKTPFSNRSYLLAGSARDLSVVGALQATDGLWEPYLMSVMKEFITDDSVCLDVGANIGAMTVVMSDLTSRGKVFAFEPSSRNLMFLRENLTRNAAANVTLHAAEFGIASDSLASRAGRLSGTATHFPKLCLTLFKGAIRRLPPS